MSTASIPYDLDRLQAMARKILISQRQNPTSLAIYHLVNKLRGVELRATVDKPAIDEDYYELPVERTDTQPEEETAK